MEVNVLYDVSREQEFENIILVVIRSNNKMIRRKYLFFISDL